MSLISVNHLTFYYEGSSDSIFEDVSFQIDTDWRLGFVARNGRGKTTFLRLLMANNTEGQSSRNSKNNGTSGQDAKPGKSYEYRGSITSTEVFDYFPFEVHNQSQNTIDIIEELYPDYEFWKICRELSLLQVDTDIFYRPYDTLSSGEQTKVMLAVLFSMEERFLLIDEPTNHLDAEARESVREYLKEKKGFILVSHDRDFLDECIDHVLVINKTNIEVYQGNFSTWWEQKNRKDAYELAENERLKKDIRRLIASAREKAAWADNVESTKIGAGSEKYEKCIDTRAYVGEKSRRMQQRRKNLERRQEREIEEKSQLLKNIETTEDLKLFPLRHYKQELVKFDEVQIYYERKEDKLKESNDIKYLKQMSFTINNGDCVALRGRNGCGKSSIIKAILQEARRKTSDTTFMQKGYHQQEALWEIKYTGEITLASGLVISYLPQDSSFLHGNIMDYAKECNLERSVFLALLRKLDFPREQFEKNMEDYSAGQRKKVLIARSLCEKAHLYIWDEPLNYIDVFSRMQIEELLKEYHPTLLLVEHDKTFVDKLCNKVINCE